MSTSCMPCCAIYPLCKQSEGKGGSKHPQWPSQQSRCQPVEECSPERVDMKDASKHEQPGYSLKSEESQDLTEQHPVSLEDQDDRPYVECADLDSSSAIVLIPFTAGEIVPEDDLDNDETILTEEKTPERPYNTAKKKSEFLLQFTNKGKV